MQHHIRIIKRFQLVVHETNLISGLDYKTRHINIFNVQKLILTRFMY